MRQQSSSTRVEQPNDAVVRRLQRGKRDAQRQRRRDAIKRVRAFRTWQRHGYDQAHAPASIPSDNDFRLARGAGR